MNTTPSQAKSLAMHYLFHTTDGWDGYSLDDVADTMGDTMVEFLTGGMTYEADVAPHCDEYCV